MHAERYVLKLRAAAARWWLSCAAGYLRFAQRWLWKTGCFYTGGRTWRGTS